MATSNEDIKNLTANDEPKVVLAEGMTKVIETADYEPNKGSYQERLKSSLTNYDYIKHDDLLNAVAELAVSPDELAKVKAIKIGDKRFVTNPHTGRLIEYSKDAYEKILEENRQEEDKHKAELESKANNNPSVLEANKNLLEAQRNEEEAVAALAKDKNNVSLRLIRNNAEKIRKTDELLAKTVLEGVKEALKNAETRKR